MWGQGTQEGIDPMKTHVFVSYAREDQDTALRIVEALEKEGLRCWVDKKGIRFGEAYTEVIDRAIRDTRVVIWVASKHSLASHYVHHEISAAQTHAKARGLVFLEPLDPSRLPAPFNVTMAGRQGAEFFRGAFEENVAKLVADIKELLRRQRRRKVLVGASVFLAAVVVAVLGVWLTLALTQRRDAAPPVALPSRVSGLPAGEVLTIAYTGQPPAAVGVERPRIRLAVLGRRAGEKTFKPLKDGDSLASEKDDYLIAAQALTDGYLYVFQVDSSGQKEWLFPRNESSAYSCGANPVKVGEIVQVPAADTRKALFLDTRTGIEHIYAVFSATRWPELEDALARKVPEKAPVTAPEPSSMLLAMVDAPNGLLLRGVGGVRPGGEALAPFAVERLDKNVKLAFHADAEPLSASGLFLVLERWFRHVTAE